MSKKFLTFSLIVFCFSFSFLSCTYNKEDELYGTACDTTDMRFSVEIKNILKAHCIDCHGGNAIGGAGIKLETYEDVTAFIDTDTTLLKSTTRLQNPMPKNSSRLAPCKINQITAWINQGAKDN